MTFNTVVCKSSFQTKTYRLSDILKMFSLVGAEFQFKPLEILPPVDSAVVELVQHQS